VDKGIARSLASCSRTFVHHNSTDVQIVPYRGLVMLLVPCCRARAFKHAARTGARYDHLPYVVSPQCACHESPIRIVRRHLRLRLPPPMSVYDPYRYRTPSTWSYSYAPSGTVSSYGSSYYPTQELPAGQVSDRMYFNLNGKLVRSYKVRTFRVCIHLFASRAYVDVEVRI
jgi:hypothetical protein